MLSKTRIFLDSRYGEFYFFAFLYVASLVLSYFFQFALQNYLPTLHAGYGLLHGDNILFHDLAADMSRNMHKFGWEAWHIFYDKNIAGTLNVAVASIFYYFLGENPGNLLPFNSLMHILSAFLLYKIIFLFSRDKLSACFSAILFVFYPITLMWVAQIHKDIYAILAWYILLYSILLNLEGVAVYKIFGMTLISCLLLFVTRPLYLYIAALIIFADIILSYFVDKRHRSLFVSFGSFAICLVFIGMFHITKPVHSSNLEAYDLSKNKRVYELAKASAGYKIDLSWNGITKNTKAQSFFIAFQNIRINQLFLSGSDANSAIDKDFIPHSEWDFIKYAPKAFSIMLFYPHPVQLLKIGNIKSYIAFLEMLIYYFFLFHLMIMLPSLIKSHVFQKIVIFALLPAFILSYINPVIGTYHRIRYPFFCLILGMGVSAFLKNPNAILYILRIKKRPL